MIKLQGALILGFATVVLGVALNRAALGQPAPASEPTAQSGSEGVSSATVITIHAKIVSMSKAKKQITLQGPQGNEVTLSVQNPYNLEAVKVGDPVVARFYEVATIRKKKPNENIPEASVKEGIVSAAQGGTPGAMAVGHISIVVSVVAIDPALGTVTVKGPDGAVETVKARDPKNLKRLKVGDQLVVTLTRAIALSVNRESQS